MNCHYESHTTVYIRRERPHCNETRVSSIISVAHHTHQWTWHLNGSSACYLGFSINIFEDPSSVMSSTVLSRQILVVTLEGSSRHRMTVQLSHGENPVVPLRLLSLRLPPWAVTYRPLTIEVLPECSASFISAYSVLQLVILHPSVLLRPSLPPTRMVALPTALDS